MEDIAEEESHHKREEHTHAAQDGHGGLLQFPKIRVIGEVLFKRKLDDERIHDNGCHKSYQRAHHGFKN